MNIENIMNLRDRGYKVKITHFRKTKYGIFPRRVIADRFGKQSIIDPTGGRVECVIENPQGILAEGVANCSEKDNFQRKVGTRMAFGRAWKKMLANEKTK